MFTIAYMYMVESIYLRANLACLKPSDVLLFISYEIFKTEHL